MKRVTERCCNGFIAKPYGFTEQQVLNRLAEYEDAEEQGLLMNLPCKMTDEVYTLHDGKVCTNRILVMGFDWAAGFCILTEDGYRYPKRLFNKNLFFSREAAEKALEDA